MGTTNNTDIIVISVQISSSSLLKTGRCGIRTRITTGRIIDHNGTGFGTFVGDRQEARGCKEVINLARISNFHVLPDSIGTQALYHSPQN